MINELKETHNQNVDQQNGFHHLLDEMKIPYREDNDRLNIGEVTSDAGWVLFLSATNDLIVDLILKVCPVIYKAGVPFSVVKCMEMATQRNDFWYGANEVGKIVSIFSIDEKTTTQMVHLLSPLTNMFWGPEVNRSIRLGEIIYVARINYVKQQDENGNVIRIAKTENPDFKNIPFKVDRKYQYWKRKRLLKGRYVPLVMISRSPKGDLLKAVDLKGLRFGWCFIKEGKYHVFNDGKGRYIKDRLQWQAKVLKELHGEVPVPEFIDYFERGEESYLVMEFLEGVDLHRRIEAIYKNCLWEDLPAESKSLLFNYFLMVLFIIDRLHQLGYVHRDATATNFMVLASGEIYAIDLELAYNLHTNEPNPPYTLGVFGYASPQQLKVMTPTIKEDVYSMGALLLHILTGKHPSCFVNRESVVDTEEITQNVHSDILRNIILRCLDLDPDKRPDIVEVRAAVEIFIS
ncbi:protein kinase [Chitinophaga varians]|uniref:Protein kinase n=1 Tax=Chitinophaga varians TaxID=2202339 RepID=A0A847S1S7_9BACT|nr:protein kinase [Chitinophaga varians]NLR68896.1 protein kinase [Chitinophaga varians]